MGKPYVYPFVDKGYYNRHEKRLFNADGTQAPSLLITRYTWKFKPKPCKGPRGGRAKKMCKCNIFYRQGVFYKAANIQLTEDSPWLNSYTVFEGVMFDAHQTSSKKQGVPIVTIECVEGIPVEVKDEEGNLVWSYFDNTITELEDLLHIPEQDRAIEPKSEIEIEEVTEIEAEPEVTELEAERVAYIESTTEEGQQLDLIAYFGYGDASWQALANVA